MSTGTETKRPTWLVVVRFGALVMVAGILISLAGSFAGFALTQLGVYVLLAGAAITLGGFLWRVAKGR